MYIFSPLLYFSTTHTPERVLFSFTHTHDSVFTGYKKFYLSKIQYNSLCGGGKLNVWGGETERSSWRPKQPIIQWLTTFFAPKLWVRFMLVWIWVRFLLLLIFYDLSDENLLNNFVFMKWKILGFLIIKIFTDEFIAIKK